MIYRPLIYPPITNLVYLSFLFSLPNSANKQNESPVQSGAKSYLVLYLLMLFAVGNLCLRHSICQLRKTVWQGNGAANSRAEGSCQIFKHLFLHLNQNDENLVKPTSYLGFLIPPFFLTCVSHLLLLFYNKDMICWLCSDYGIMGKRSYFSNFLEEQGATWVNINKILIMI